MGTGGGYGAPGGSVSVSDPGGDSYGHTRSTMDIGSGGGSTLTSEGGKGGGLAIFTVEDTFNVEGELSKCLLLNHLEFNTLNMYKS